MKRNICILVLTGLVFAAFCSGQKPTTLPATQPTEPASELAKMRSFMERSPGDERRSDFGEVLKQRLPKALAILTEMERKYPKAEELHQARLMGLVATIQLVRLNNDQAGTERAKEIAARIMASDAPGRFKLNADAHLLLLNLKPIGAATTAPATNPAPVDTTKIIMQFAQRYAGTDQAVDAITAGMQIGAIVGNRKVFDELVEKLAKDYADHPRARIILRQLGKSPYVGKDFTATLTKLDGTKLTLPDDLRGKVIVVDFWATWCAPCVQTIPQLKSLYAEYKPQGVEIVGISLDEDPQRLKAFVATNQMGWIIAHKSKGFDDPAKKYGISSIPSIWVIGRDGKVVSDNA
ncbi:MAG: TlpA family protein disulfide reductase [Phycisphaerae bacterium]|nr:TlpA family protein disulfide reductase [Phycisphaerae bacterium]